MDSLRDVVRSLRAKKSLGQHFLTDPHILGRIVDAAGPLEGRTVIEIGPGPGGLTRAIAARSCEELILIEPDTRCAEHLDALKKEAIPQVTLIQADALSIPLHTLGHAPRKIIANLPYNVSVPLLLQCLQHMDAFESLTLMFQKEVADRLIASPNTADYGRLSVMCQWRARVERLFDLPPGAFLPPPKVDSTVVHVTPREPCADVSWQALEKMTALAFSKRRKMLRSSLKGIISTDELDALGINPERRAETLSIKEFCALAILWEKKR